MGYRKFRTDEPRKPDKRRSKTKGEGTGQITSDMKRIYVDSKTIVFVRPEADAKKVERQWITKAENDKRYLKKLNEDVPSKSESYKKAYLKKVNRRNREKRNLKKSVAPF